MTRPGLSCRPGAKGEHERKRPEIMAITQQVETDATQSVPRLKGSERRARLLFLCQSLNSSQHFA